MNRTNFQEISKIRVKEAKVLLSGGCYIGAYYLLGYAVECALKACIAKQVNRHDFPNKTLANNAYTHDLQKLLEVAGLLHEFKKDRQTNKVLDVNWAVVKDWSEEIRYKVGITKADARDFFSACNSRKNGILTWIKKKW